MIKEKLTILISAKNKKLIQEYARQQNKSISRVIEDLLNDLNCEIENTKAKDEWIERTAGIYRTGKKDVLHDLFEHIKK
jgi:hypothetical protein